MDKFALSRILRKSAAVDKNKFICAKCLGRDVLDLGCVRHKAKFSAFPGWLHSDIRAAAKSLAGVDCAYPEVEELKKQGYNVSAGDVTGNLGIEGKFDVVVASDLIEHLDNFKGFFDNCRKFLRPQGTLIVSTPNPFYLEGIHFLLFKKFFTVNPEHTCWIDPLCLAQLAGRAGFSIKEIRYIKNRWKAKDIICESVRRRYDTLNDCWENDSFGFKFFRLGFGLLFAFLYFPYKIFSGGYSGLLRYSEYVAVLAPDNALYEK